MKNIFQILLIFIVCVMIPIELIGLGVAYFIESSFIKNSAPATATITSTESSVNSEGTTMYKPVYTFTAADGREISATPNWSSSNKPTLGVTREILYRTDQPDSVKLDKLWSKFTFSLIFTVVASVLTLFAFAALVILKLVFKQPSAPRH